MVAAFEALKVTMRQDREGTLITLRIHNDQIPEELVRDFVGTRYNVTMEAIGDDEKPLRRPAEEETRKLLASAALLCKEPDFGAYLTTQGYTPLGNHTDEGVVANALCRALGIGSRSALPADQDARSRFIALRKDYIQWRKDPR